jgi:hypothetical protein
MNILTFLSKVVGNILFLFKGSIIEWIYGLDVLIIDSLCWLCKNEFIFFYASHAPEIFFLFMVIVLVLGFFF